MTTADERTLVDACRRFERAWHQDATPKIEVYVRACPEHLHGEVERELQAVRAELVADASPEIQEKLGDFRLLREIGRGGMARVYEAVQESLQRRVALKVLMVPAAHEEGIQRFAHEAQVAAGLHHTNIVAVYGVGEEDGTHYLAMQLIDGCGLDRVLQAEPTTGEPALIAKLRRRDDPERFREIARIGLCVAEALAYAHERKVLHRDIKPANLLVDQSGNLWVADFGLAKSLREDSELTLSGQLVGTLQYAPPEAFENRWLRRSDVYSLGMTLYRLLTMTRAFDDTNQTSLVKQIVQQTPSAPRIVDSKIPRDLDTIITKSIEKSPSHRYQTARLMADDLRRFLNQEPIVARPLNVAQRLVRWGQREPIIASLIGTVGLTLIIGLLSTMWQWRKAENTAKSELQARLEAQQLQRQRSEQLIGTYLDRWNNQVLEGNPMESLASLSEASIFAEDAWPADSKELEDMERFNRIRLATTLAQVPVLTQMWFDLPNSWALRPLFHPNGKWIVMGTAAGAQLYDIKSGEKVGPVLSLQEDLGWMALSPNGKRLATGSETVEQVTPERPNQIHTQTVRVWSMEDFSPVTDELPYNQIIMGGEFSASGRHLVVNGYTGFQLFDCEKGAAMTPYLPMREVMGYLPMKFVPNTDTVISCAQRWDLRDGRAMDDLFEDPERAFGMAFSVDGRLLATGHVGYLNVWDLTAGRRLFPPVRFNAKGNPHKVAFSDDDRFVAIVAGAVTMIVDVETGKRVGRLLGHGSEVSDIAFSPAGNLIATAGDNMKVQLWHVPSGKPSGATLAHDAPVTHLTFHDDGSMLLTTSADGITRLWNLSGSIDGRKVVVPGVCEAALMPDGEHIVASFADKHTRVFHSAQPEKILREIPHPHVPQFLELGDDGRRAVVTSGKGSEITTEVWDLTSDQDQAQPLESGRVPRDIALSPDSSQLAIFHSVFVSVVPLDLDLNRVHSNIIRAPNGRGHRSNRSFVFAPDSSRFYVGSKYSVTEYLSDVEPWTKTSRLAPVTEANVSPVALSQDGSLIAAGAGDSLIQLVDAHSMTVLRSLRVPGTKAFEFSPDSRHLAVASSRGFARVFDVTSGRLVSHRMIHRSAVTSVAYAPEDWMATAAGVGNVKIWETVGYRALSAPLAHNSPITRLQFFPNGEQILTTTADRVLTIWELPHSAVISRSDANRLCHFLSRRAYNDIDELETQSSADLALEWQSIRTDHPEWFKVSAEQSRNWREQQIVLARTQGNDYALQFHQLHLEND